MQQAPWCDEVGGWHEYCGRGGGGARDVQMCSARLPVESCGLVLSNFPFILCTPLPLRWIGHYVVATANALMPWYEARKGLLGLGRRWGGRKKAEALVGEGVCGVALRCTLGQMAFGRRMGRTLTAAL